MDDETKRSSEADERGEPVPVSIEEALQVAVSLHRDGRLSEAGAIYRGVLQSAPEHPVALHYLGLLSHQRGDTEAGIEMIRRAVTIAPTYAEALGNLGNVYLQAGRPDGAVDAYRQAIDLAPGNPAAHNNLGVALKAVGRIDDAVSSYRRAVELAPGEADYSLNLARTLADVGRRDEAIDLCRRNVDAHPDHAASQLLLGNVLATSGSQEEALEAYAAAAALNAEHAETHCNMGHTLMRGRIPRDAADAYTRALALEPGLEEAWIGLTKALYVSKDLDALAIALRRWSEVAPANPVPRHMLAGLTGKGTPSRASDDYVRQVFDGFASSFDAQLEALDYRVPELVAHALATTRSPDASVAILDAGCGTGLCGPLLRPFASRLVGVDLSSAMLARAAAREAYDDLVEAELTGFLQDNPGAFDVIVAADTLVYFGALEGVLGAAAGALGPRGQLVFTVEALEDFDVPEGYRLEPHGRYGHGQSYVRRSILEAGLELEASEMETLRLEAGEPVSGLLVVARRSEECG